MKREEAIKQYIMPALKRTWRDDMCIEIISAIEQDPCEVVLNKIRAEIVELQKDYQEYEWLYDDVLGIIDKYKENT